MLPTPPWELSGAHWDWLLCIESSMFTVVVYVERSSSPLSFMIFIIRISSLSADYSAWWHHGSLFWLALLDSALWDAVPIKTSLQVKGGPLTQCQMEDFRILKAMGASLLQLNCLLDGWTASEPSAIQHGGAATSNLPFIRVTVRSVVKYSGCSPATDQENELPKLPNWDFPAGLLVCFCCSEKWQKGSLWGSSSETKRGQPSGRKCETK